MTGDFIRTMLVDPPDIHYRIEGAEIGSQRLSSGGAWRRSVGSQ
jgi:hypothetical protein